MVIKYTPANATDYRAVAALHTRNWKRDYQGMMRDEYLANEVEEDRLTVWKQRIGQPSPNQFIQLAWQADQLIGFVCLYYKSPEEYPGAYLDNIHVAPEAKRQGVGAQLLRNAARWVHQQSATRSLYLWVLTGNEGAIRFYERLEGRAEAPIEKEIPGGGRGMVIRYVWENTNGLI